MRRKEASFAVRLLTSSSADRADVDRVLTIFVRNTSPLLRTKTNQIRAKIASPDTSEGRLYFAAFYRSETVIGFAMFGHYPRRRLIVVDHLVIDSEQRGNAAFYVFAQLLQDAIHSLTLEVDFTAVEIEKGAEFGGGQTGGHELVRLLGQVGFGQVHTDYVLANTEPRNYQARYDGVLMLRGEERLHRIRREDLIEIYHGILFDHYLPWYREFFGEKIGSYEEYLARLSSAFEERLRDEPVVKVNGPETNFLIPPPSRPSEATSALHLLMFTCTAGVLATVLYVLKTPPYLMLPVMFAVFAVFVGVVLTSSGQAREVLDWITAMLPGGKRRSRYLQQRPKTKPSPKADQQLPDKKIDAADRSLDKPN